MCGGVKSLKQTIAAPSNVDNAPLASVLYGCQGNRVYQTIQRPGLRTQVGHILGEELTRRAVECVERSSIISKGKRLSARPLREARKIRRW